MKRTGCTSLGTVASGPEREGPSTNFIAQMGYDRKEANFFKEIVSIPACIYILCLKKCLLMLHMLSKLALLWLTETASKNLILNLRQGDS